MHEAVIDAFRSYLNTPATEHALLLTGRWGSGKTFLWRNHLEPAAKETGRPTAYVSLYSCNSLEDITVQLYLGLMEAPAEDSVPGFLRAVSGTASFAFSFFREEHGPVLSEESKKKARETTVRNLVICFDDLERSAIPVEKLLGYVNELTERHRCKALILCNEEEMRERDSYEKFKEKTVGRAIAVQVDYPEVVASIIGQFAESSAYHSFLQEHADTVVQIFERSGTRNIRLARLGLSWMHIVYTELKGLSTFHTIIYGAKLLKIVMACCFEQMSHLVARDDVLADIFAERGHIASMEHEPDPGSTNAYIADFLRRYYVSDVSEFFTPRFLLEFMRDGTLDRERMREELPLPKVTDPIQESVNLFLSQDYLGLDDETFDKHLANVRIAVERGRIGSLREYARLFVV
ncbi:MAG: P-loop NTPase fold protein, partial [Oceanidesulfovibrio sp.]